MSTLSPLMDLIDAYVAATGFSDTRLSSRLFNDSKKIAALRAGSDITTTRLDGAISWFAKNWPDGAEWPASVSRLRVDGEAAA